MPPGVRVINRKRETWQVDGFFLGYSVFGTTHYVDSVNGDNGNTGFNPQAALATLAQAIANATANVGDVIVLAPGHAETLTASLALSKAGVQIIGLGRGSNRPAFTCNANVDLFTITGANVELRNILFNESGAAHTSQINIGAPDILIARCQFDCGANEVESITIEAAGDRLIIEKNEFHVTANGPKIGIEIEAAGVAGLIVRNNWFDGGNDTNAWDTGAINSAVAHTGCLIEDNTFVHGPAIIFSSTALGIIRHNIVGEGTLAAMIDPGSCMCYDNFEADAVDQSGRLFPTTVAS